MPLVGNRWTLRRTRYYPFALSIFPDRNGQTFLVVDVQADVEPERHPRHSPFL
jgi:hypothetical protein